MTINNFYLIILLATERSISLIGRRQKTHLHIGGKWFNEKQYQTDSITFKAVSGRTGANLIQPI